MNTKAFEQFEVMSDVQLSTVESGNKEARDLAYILGTTAMEGAGFLAAGAAGSACI